MRRAHSVEQVRAAEAALVATVPDGALMERAVAGLVPTILDLTGGAYGLRVVLLVGSGDNGGDALLAGAKLASRGARVDAVLLSTSRHRHVETLRRAGGLIHSITGDDDPAPGVLTVDTLLDERWWQRADVVIDGILGIGGSGGLREPAATVVDLVSLDAIVVAVDLPSGVEPDSGEVHGAAVIADVTVCMGTHKPGLLIDPAAAYAGALELVDIGLDAFLPEPVVEALQVDDVLDLLPYPGRDADKYGRGAVGVIAGSTAYPGAAILSVAGAVRGGAGYVRGLVPSHVADAVREQFPEVVVTPIDADAAPHDAHAEVGAAESVLAVAGRVQSYVVGPGLGTHDTALAYVTAVVESSIPAVFDADALTVLAQHPDVAAALSAREAQTLLTPHAGELARLLGVEREVVEAQRLVHVQEAARRFGATVLLKGSTTLVASDDERPVRSNPTGTAWLGTAGSGDVLSGLAGAYLAAGLDALDAGSCAAFVHGVAAQMASEAETTPLRALDLATALPGAVAALRDHEG